MTEQNQAAPAATDRIKTRDRFNQCMKEVDALIKQASYKDAATRLSEARSIDPGNPYVKAFEERIIALEKGPKGPKPAAGHHTAPGHTTIVHAHPAPSSPTTVIPQPPVQQQVKHTPPPPVQQMADAAPVDHHILEAKLREQIEQEFRNRYTHELRSAEKKAAIFLEQEQEKIKKQRDILKTHYEDSLAQMQKQLQGEYQTKLDDEVQLAEERLRKQFEAEQLFFENEMKETLTSHYEQKVQELEQRLQQQQNELLQKEKSSFEEKDRAMKEQYNQRLLEELRKAESVIFQQTEQQKKVEEEKLKDRLTKEFERKIKAEQDQLAREYEAQQAKLNDSFKSEKERLHIETERQISEKIEEARKREAQEYEHKRTALLQQLETEHKNNYEKQLEAERARMRAESDSALEAERDKARKEREQLLEHEAEVIRKTRRDLRTEMDKNLVQRLEQLQSDYERKIDLLGISIPKTEEERIAFYRDRLRTAYAEGEPNVDQARNLFELKELLELSYEDHIRLDSEVRLEQYVQSLEKGLMAGSLDLLQPASLEELKNKFHILPEEASQVEAFMLSKMKEHVYRGTILLADDEDDIRLPLGDTLEGEGYHVITCATVREALERLSKERVDLIVSDIKFGPGEPDGFKFFQAVQKLPDQRNTPFILLSSLTDDVIVRSGVELGVDDYLTKPVDPELLVAVIKGKLKRKQKG